MRRIALSGKKKKILDTIFGVVLGNLVLAFTVAAFMVPHGIIMGGSTGVGLIVKHYFGLPLSGVILVSNLLLFFLGTFVLGKKFAINTLLSTFLFPLSLSLVEMIPKVDQITDNMMLATIYGGMLLGLGIGMIVRVGASTGGTDILALVLNKSLHIPVAILLYVVDFILLGFQFFFSTGEQVLYGVLNLFITSLVLNRVMLYGKSQIQIFVITEKSEEVREKILKHMDAGVTMVQLETGFSREKQQGVLCVIPPWKLYTVKEAIQSIDPQAFITISQINEVSGRGFTLEKYDKEITS